MATDISQVIKSCTINVARHYRIDISENELEKFIGNSAEKNNILDDEAEMTISVLADDNNALFSIDLRLLRRGDRANILASENAVEFELKLPDADKVLGNSHNNIWWMIPQFCNRFDELKPCTQGALMKSGNEYIYLLPLNGDNCFCELGEGRAYLSIGSMEYDRVSGYFLCVSKSDDPYKAIENAYYFARKNGGIKGKLVEEKEWPRQLRGLGMCTWNMCYKDLTSEKIYQKLDELREKKIPVKWFLFDNGWLQLNEHALASFKEDKNKIPEGLKECIRKIKKAYGIEYVGVWHTFNGYSMGIDPNSELFEEQKENLEKTAGGIISISGEAQKAFNFWDSWHTYLEECGVDFIKVDSQSTYPVLCEGTKSNIYYTRSNHNALEMSAEKHFGGAVINCMGMDMLNVLERNTAISRTSGDFDPHGSPVRFYKHLVQDAWNSLWHGRMYIGDFDMVWSSSGDFLKHEGVLRAISGGPVYLSDEIGTTIYENIRPCINKDGSLPVMEHCALPTRDIIFEDCYKSKRLVKLWNEKNKNIALALFTREAVTDEIIYLSCIPGIKCDSEYMVYEYFTKTKTVMKGSDSFKASLNPDEVRAYSIMPIENGEYDFFDEKLYFPFAGKKISDELII